MAWNVPSYNSTELNACETSTILIRASHNLDGLIFECQNGSNGTPTSHGRAVLSVTCTFVQVDCVILSAVKYSISVFLIAAPPKIPMITNVGSDNPKVLTIEWPINGRIQFLRLAT